VPGAAAVRRLRRRVRARPCWGGRGAGGSSAAGSLVISPRAEGRQRTSGKASLNRGWAMFQAWLRAAKARLCASEEVTEPVVISSESMNERRPVNLWIPYRQHEVNRGKASGRQARYLTRANKTSGTTAGRSDDRRLEGYFKTRRYSHRRDAPCGIPLQRGGWSDGPGYG
jgi:hypothetical protein